MPYAHVGSGADGLCGRAGRRIPGSGWNTLAQGAMRPMPSISVVEDTVDEEVTDVIGHAVAVGVPLDGVHVARVMGHADHDAGVAPVRTVAAAHEQVVARLRVVPANT